MNMTTDTHRSPDYRVEFSGVGRNKVSWSASLKQMPTEHVLVSLVRKKKALMSNNIWCAFDNEEFEYGTVFAGMRPVGAFRVTELQP